MKSLSFKLLKPFWFSRHIKSDKLTWDRSKKYNEEKAKIILITQRLNQYSIVA